MTFDLNKLVRPNVAAMEAYSSARSEYNDAAQIFLDANESPFENGINRYPDSDPLELRKAIAVEKKLSYKQVALGNGSDEIIDLLMRAFGVPAIDKVASLEPSYGMYAVSAAINDLEYIPVQSSKSFDLDESQIASFCSIENLKLIFLCSPNNPTGNRLNPSKVKKLLGRFDGIVVVDEAYIDFCPEKSLVPLLKDYPNLVISQTFSKARAAAGIRMGCLFGSPEIVEIIHRIKPPYNLSTLNQKRALGLINDKKWVQERSQILIEREALFTFLNGLSYVDEVLPSEANFILFKSNEATRLFQYLKDQGIIIRDRQKQVKDALRVSIGSPEEMSILKTALSQFA